MKGINPIRVDHIHRYTTDKWDAAKWYNKVFGFEIWEKMRGHAEAYPKAPLDIVNANETIVIALFSTNAEENLNSTSTIALRVSSEDFIVLLRNAEAWEIKKRNGAPLSEEDIIFHTPTGDTSVYFVDPWGNSIEIIAVYTDEMKDAFPAAKSLYR